MQRSSAKTRRLIAASGGSLALHALVVALVARISWEAEERAEHSSVEVVWLADLPIPDAVPVPVEPERVSERPPESEPEPPPASPAEPDSPPPDSPPPDSPPPDSPPPDSPPPDSPPPDSPPPDSPPDVPPTDETLPPADEASPDVPAADETSLSPETPVEPEPPPEPESTTAPPPAAPSSEAPTADDSDRSFVITEAELEEAWRRAVEEMRAQRELEESYLTFSHDDLADAVPPEERDSPESIFEAAERYAGSGGPSVLSPGRARTRVGRALAEFCNALTGGVGVGLNGIGLFSLCAERGESAKLFARIKPAYLRSRPVCREVETGALAAEGGTPTIKCELVVEDELAEHELQ